MTSSRQRRQESSTRISRTLAFQSNERLKLLSNFLNKKSSLNFTRLENLSLRAIIHMEANLDRTGVIHEDCFELSKHHICLRH